MRVENSKGERSVGREESPGVCPEQCQQAEKDEELQMEEAGDTQAGNNVTKDEKEAWL